MGNNILVINSSPRKGGNSETLCDRLIEGAQANGATCVKVSLREKKINCCIACDLCRSNPWTCSIDDDMPEIWEKMKEADVIVLSTPSYFFSVSAQLKMTIDRFRPVYKSMPGKKFAFIATVSGDEPELLEKTFGAMNGLLDCFPDASEEGRLYGNSACLPGDSRNTKAYEEAYELGKRLASI